MNDFPSSGFSIDRQDFGQNLNLQRGKRSLGLKVIS